MPETTPGSGASALPSRARHYAAYTAAFLVVYGGFDLWQDLRASGESAG